MSLEHRGYHWGPNTERGSVCRYNVCQFSSSFIPGSSRCLWSSQHSALLRRNVFTSGFINTQISSSTQLGASLPSRPVPPAWIRRCRLDHEGAEAGAAGEAESCILWTWIFSFLRCPSRSHRHQGTSRRDFSAHTCVLWSAASDYQFKVCRLLNY